MNKNLNLVEKLKDVPRGTKLWSPICGECELYNVNSNTSYYPIKCISKKHHGLFTYVMFTANGKYSHYFANGECVLFPSKGNHDWSTFKVPVKHKHFKPFQKVLCVIDLANGRAWVADLYSHYDDSTGEHYLVSGYVVDDDEIIPYNGNEDKLGKKVENEDNN